MKNLFDTLNLQNLSILNYIDHNYVTGFYWGVGITSIVISSYFIYSYLNYSQPNNKDNKEDLNKNQQVNSPSSISSDDTIRNKDPKDVYSNNPETSEDPFDSTLIPQPSTGYFARLSDYFKLIFKTQEDLLKYKNIPKIIVPSPNESQSILNTSHKITEVQDIGVGTSPVTTNEASVNTDNTPIINVTSFEEINTISKLTTDANVGTISNLASTIIEYLL